MCAALCGRLKWTYLRWCNTITACWRAEMSSSLIRSHFTVALLVYGLWLNQNFINISTRRCNTTGAAEGSGRTQLTWESIVSSSNSGQSKTTVSLAASKCPELADLWVFAGKFVGSLQVLVHLVHKQTTDTTLQNLSRMCKTLNHVG